MEKSLAFDTFDFQFPQVGSVRDAIKILESYSNSKERGSNFYSPLV